MYGLVNRAIGERVCSRARLAPVVGGLINGLAERVEMAVSVIPCADTGDGEIMTRFS